MVNWTVHTADILTWARDYDGPRFHAILSDPPYGLAFMAKGWDKFSSPRAFQAWVTEWATLLIENVLHPGALAMFFGGSRTVHRLTCGLEDAGFEIRDTIMWMYGSGFPKSHNVSKAIDRALGAEREQVGIAADFERNGYNENPDNHAPRTTLGPIPNGNRWAQPITTPATPQAANWDGYGTALKPAYEPVVVCQAPRGKATFAELTMEHGSGALNIDGCRVGKNPGKRTNGPAGAVYDQSLGYNAGTEWQGSPQGRWPSNVILSHAGECAETCAPGCPVAELDRQSGARKSGGNVYETPRDNGTAVSFTRGTDNHTPFESYNDSGGASRFFYTPKASRAERDAGLDEFGINDKYARNGQGGSHEVFVSGDKSSAPGRNPHPCVKPLAITTYLAKLLLPPPLDGPRRAFVPFCGTGSEVAALWRAGWDEIVGVELDADYAAMAEARVLYWSEVGVQGEMFGVAQLEADAVHFRHERFESESQRINSEIEAKYKALEDAGESVTWTDEERQGMLF